MANWAGVTLGQGIFGSGGPHGLFAQYANAFIVHPGSPIAEWKLVPYARLVTCAVVEMLILAILFLAHRLVAICFAEKTRYFALHVLHNVAIVYFSLGDVVAALRDPRTANACVDPGAGAGCSNLLPLLVNLGLHLYHPLAFGPLKAIDWIHHVPNYVCTILALQFNWRSNLNLQLFALTGVPGGVEYALLVCLGQGWMSRFCYKRWSARINVYMRAPLAVISAYIGLTSLAFQWDLTPALQVVVTFVLNAHALWNGPFFMRNAVEAHVVEVINSHNLKIGHDGDKPLRTTTVQRLANKTPRAKSE